MCYRSRPLQEPPGSNNGIYFKTVFGTPGIGSWPRWFAITAAAIYLAPYAITFAVLVVSAWNSLLR